MFSNEPVLSLKGANIWQDEKCVLNDVNLELEKGEFVFVIGKTGGGKSSLLKTIYADLPLRDGQGQVGGVQLNGIKRGQVPQLRRRLGIIFQDFQLFYDRSIMDNLLFVMKATGWTDRSKMRKRVSELLMRVGLGSVENKMPHQLSGGEQQRVVIARALVNEPILLVADEPTGNLDPEVSRGIMQVFQAINNSGTAVIMATHNHYLLNEFPARVLRCEDGRVTEAPLSEFSKK